MSRLFASSRATRCLSLMALGILLLGGCGPQAQRLSDAQVEVSERVEKQVGFPILWDAGTEIDSAVSRRLTGLVDDGLTVDEAVQFALLRNPDAYTEYERLGVAQADLVAAGLLSNPVFDLSLRFPEGGGGTNLEIGVAQSFLDVFLIAARRRVAAAEFEAAKSDITASILDLAARTRMAFIEYQAAVRLTELSGEAAETAGASAEMARTIHVAGNISALHVGRHEAEEAHALAESRAALLELTIARNTLLRLMGRPDLPADWGVPSLSPDPADREPSLQAAMAWALVNRQDLAAARLDVEAARAALGLAKDAILEEGAIGVDAEREPDGHWVTGPNLEIPLPLFGHRAAEVARHHALLRQRLRRAEGAEADVLSEVEEAHARLLSTRAALSYEARVLPAIEERNRQAQFNEFNSMAAGVFDVIEAHQALVEARMLQAKAVTAYWAARADLVRSLGGSLPPADSTWIDGFDLEDPAAALAGRADIAPAPAKSHVHEEHLHQH